MAKIAKELYEPGWSLQDSETGRWHYEKPCTRGWYLSRYGDFTTDDKVAADLLPDEAKRLVEGFRAEYQSQEMPNRFKVV